MPKKFAVLQSPSTTESDELLAALVGRNRLRQMLGNTNSVTATVPRELVGRDRHPKIHLNESKTDSSLSRYRKRFRVTATDINTESVCNRVTSVPPPKAPIGDVFFDGKPLKGQKLHKNAFYTIGFTATGTKLIGLVAELTLSNLANQEIVKKQVVIDPGGIIFDDQITTNYDGTQVFTGYIVLTPEDTKFVGSPSEFEVKYHLELRNKTIRRYPIADGIITFVNH